MNRNKQFEIERKTESIRDKCRVLDYGFQNIFESAEKIGYRVIRYPIGENEFLGFALIKHNEKIVFSNSSQILSREIFSIAHEIGHHELHLSEQDKTLIMDDDFNDRDEFEIEANYFAACLLMPEEQIQKFIRFKLNNKPSYQWGGAEIAQFQTTFNVSYDMVLNRLKWIKIIDGEIFSKLKLIKQEQSATKLLSVYSGNIGLCRAANVKGIPSEFLEWVIFNYNEKLIPIKSAEIAFKYVDLNASDLLDVAEEENKEYDFAELLGRMD